jgi:Rad3-related DNA helicase
MLCRRLERELNAANERIKNLESALCTVQNIDKVNAYQDLESANERIKRLEEAGDAMLNAWLMPEDAMEYRDWVALSADAEAMWLKSKEAKP